MSKISMKTYRTAVILACGCTHYPNGDICCKGKRHVEACNDIHATVADRLADLVSEIESVDYEFARFIDSQVEDSVNVTARPQWRERAYAGPSDDE